MPFDVEMTGAGDYSRQIKMAICGQAGAGKTLISSTAPNPIYIFFREQPRIMSIADRFMPHIKVLPEVEDGKLKVPVEDKMHEILDYLRTEEAQELYDTVVIDTGDELQRALKEGKKLRNRGAWHIQDWGWLSDVYYSIVNAFIDLPMNVIVLYHLKNTQEGDDGQIIKELALQGATKDDAPGWFDIVGVLSAFESVDEKGRKSASRGFLTEPTPRYGWVKDHSGKLPNIYQVTDDFVGDFDVLHDMIYGGVEIASEHETLATVTVEITEPTVVEEHPGVPTPEEVEEKKQERSDKVDIKEKIEAAREAKQVENVEEDVPSTGVPLDDVVEIAAEIVAEDEAANVVPETPAETMTMLDDEEGNDGAVPAALPHCEADVDGEPCGAIPMTQQFEDGVPVVGDDGEPVLVVDETLVELGQVRFRKVLCKKHLGEARKAAKK